ncbi:MAG: hypothetical protein BGO26_09495 [Actinobacteria bacterium 69-20]|jgi:uncharacterized protein with HEPN domain|nr:DUF86 domain-containing protein [Actinomycetota bacterium]OJV23167.1 MAG: hypothetical protein BGO26_09495 [Actinobacteria bacterium 69-20]
MQPRSKALLWDAREAARAAQSFIGQDEFSSYQANNLLRSAVERQLTIVGEALAQLRTIDPETAALVPDVSKIVGFRNVLVHGYGEIDQELVWTAASRDSSRLISAISALLDEGAPTE